MNHYLNGLVQDCSNSSAYTLELLQFCTKPSICTNLDGLDYWGIYRSLSLIVFNHIVCLSGNTVGKIPKSSTNKKTMKWIDLLGGEHSQLDLVDR